MNTESDQITVLKAEIIKAESKQNQSRIIKAESLKGQGEKDGRKDEYKHESQYKHCRIT